MIIQPLLYETIISAFSCIFCENFSKKFFRTVDKCKKKLYNKREMNENKEGRICIVENAGKNFLCVFAKTKD